MEHETLFNQKKSYLPQARLVTSDFSQNYSLKFREEFYKKINPKDMQIPMD